MFDIKNFQPIPPVNRLVGEMPKIGIRPAIDGRRKGVRESLDDQVMALARTTADFLSANLRHSNGLPVECVIPIPASGALRKLPNLRKNLPAWVWGCP
jgi:L-fucose isomerase